MNIGDFINTNVFFKIYKTTILTPGCSCVCFLNIFPLNINKERQRIETLSTEISVNSSPMRIYILKWWLEVSMCSAHLSLYAQRQWCSCGYHQNYQGCITASFPNKPLQWRTHKKGKYIWWWIMWHWFSTVNHGIKWCSNCNTYPETPSFLPRICVGSICILSLQQIYFISINSFI